ncbi:hypothetical protein [Dyella kyungheensis]|uniref:Uncharacterized protein n=1 Tax=Dyella kyungheensis TaxID=1242174 RepID=A0ABS2JRC0_9GAMM|nr:hypothetical protein [Dyella kyungheensis]MBM7121503.1 hypothetical protein [Dyella kyungheensis]
MTARVAPATLNPRDNVSAFFLLLQREPTRGPLIVPDTISRTYFLAVDGPNNTSVVYQATTVDALDNPRQPHRELTGGRYLVMKPVANPFTSLADTMLNFYRAQPVGWTKEFTPER